MAGLHHPVDRLEVPHVFQRIALEDQEIGQLSGLDRTQLAFPAHDPSAMARVAATITCDAVIPASTMSRSSRKIEGPCKVPMLPASVPAAIATPPWESRFKLGRSGRWVGSGREGRSDPGRVSISSSVATSGSPQRCSAGVGLQRPESASR